MSGSLYSELGRRESQIMDIVYRLEEADAETVRVELSDDVSNSTVRTMLRHLEEKGYLKHRKEGRRYVYYPARPKAEVRRTMLQHLTETFFGGSVSEAVATLLSAEEGELTSDTLDELERLIDQAQADAPSSGRGTDEAS
jgi:predicted transcriptional regulator